MTLTLARGTFGLRPTVERNREAAIVQPPRAALVAQLDRASDFESEGREFESLRARQILMTMVCWKFVEWNRFSYFVHWRWHRRSGPQITPYLSSRRATRARVIRGSPDVRLTVALGGLQVRLELQMFRRILKRSSKVAERRGWRSWKAPRNWGERRSLHDDHLICLTFFIFFFYFFKLFFLISVIL